MVGGSSVQGRLEVKHNGVWGTVCDDWFEDADAKVACYMLGYGYSLVRFLIHITTPKMISFIYDTYNFKIGQCFDEDMDKQYGF